VTPRALIADAPAAQRRPRTTAHAVGCFDLHIGRGLESRATLAGPRDVVEAIGAALGLSVRGCGDDRIAAIDHPSDAVLFDAARLAGHDSVPWFCNLCDAARSGVCVVHRRMP